ncbi:CBL-interacting serine/threonine-protein kinase 9 [Glycine max]|nr:CBL-interacting serine/threonine-protein kinase 9 [Glycine max]
MACGYILSLPENLLLDLNGVLKVTDFGLSTYAQQEDELLRTACGIPNYVAPEVLNDRGYVGSTSDIWLCGVILFVLMAGYLPFVEPNHAKLYKKIGRAQFTCPSWFSPKAKKLLKLILDPNPLTRIKVPELLKDEWFKKGYKQTTFIMEEDINVDDVAAAFNDSKENLVTERKEKPVSMNAFEHISRSQSFNLENLFEKQQGSVKRETHFTSQRPTNEIMSKIEEVAKPLGFNVHKRNYKETLVKFLSKATGTTINWVQMIGMKPGPNSIGIVVSRNCSGVAARAYGLVRLEPTKVAEILKDRPSWYCDCRCLNVLSVVSTGNGGTIELMYMQTYAPTTLAAARDFWTLRYATSLEDGSLMIYERSLTSSTSGPTGPAALNFIRAEMLPTGESDLNDYNLRLVLTIAFQFTFENHLRDNVTVMARQHVHNVVRSIQRVAMAIAPSRLSSQLGSKSLPGPPEALTLARWICKSYRLHTWTELFSVESTSGDAILKQVWHHPDAVLCCSVKTDASPVFTFANQLDLTCLKPLLLLFKT